MTTRIRNWLQGASAADGPESREARVERVEGMPTPVKRSAAADTDAPRASTNEGSRAPASPPSGSVGQPSLPETVPPCALAVHGLCKTFARGERPALDDVSLEVREGEILALVGESGSGKTTLLRLIAGLERPDDGTIVISGQTHCAAGCFTPPEDRGAPLVFQDYALFPHLTVAENIGFGLRRLGRRERRERVTKLLQLIGLEELGERYPHELSGGQQQRVALARALALRPPLILLDEPFSNLDRALKSRLREEVATLLRETNTTAILVVHDYEDALAVGDRIAVLRDGELIQIGDASEIRGTPYDEYVAAFFGD